MLFNYACGGPRFGLPKRAYLRGGLEDTRIEATTLFRCCSLAATLDPHHVVAMRGTALRPWRDYGRAFVSYADSSRNDSTNNRDRSSLHHRQSRMR